MTALSVVEQEITAEPQPGAPVAARRARPWADLGSMAVILAFALLYLNPIFSGKVPIAADTLSLWYPWAQQAQAPVRNLPLADSGVLYLSWESFAKSAITDGEWPMWDPYSFSGSPFAANAQNQVYYPVTWLLWLLPLSGAIQALAVFNICLAGWGMYFLCRVLGLSRPAALLAGLAFCGSGILQTSLEITGVASVYGWLPWMLLTSELALRERSLRWTAAAALCCGLQMVAGHLQWVIYSLFALGAWLLVRSIQLSIVTSPTRRFSLDLRRLAGSLGRSLAIPLVGVALASVHLAPFLELTTRASRSSVRVTAGSEPLLYMLRSVLPSFFGTPLVVPNYPLMYNNLWYVGLAPLLLVVVGIFSRPRTAAIFWAAMSLFAVLVTFGIGPFLYVRWLPGLQAMLPNRIGYLFVVGVCILAAIGADAWLALAARRREFGLLALLGLVALSVYTIYPSLSGWLAHSPWVTGAFPAQFASAMSPIQEYDLKRAVGFGVVSLVVLGVVLLLRGRRSSWAMYALVPILVLDLMSAVPDYNSYVQPKDLRPGTKGIRWLRQQPGQWRMLPVGTDKIPPSFVPNSHLIFNLPSVDGYDSLHDTRYDQFWGVVDPALRPKPGSDLYDNVFVRPQAYTSTIASLLNVKYIVSSVRLAPLEGHEKWEGPDVYIYENPSVMPRAFLVGSASVMPDKDILARLADPGFDPSKEVLLNSQPGVEANTQAGSSGASPGSVNITAYHRNSVDLEASVNSQSYLVLGDPNYPGWHVSVDGQERPLLTADYLLRGVSLSPGEHTIRFWFLPSYFIPTLALSLLALALVIAALVFGRFPGTQRATGVTPVS